MVDKIVKVAVYARVSTQEQAVEGTSLEHQSEQLKKYCESQGWEIFLTYVDPGYTGKDDNRPGLKHMLSDAKSGLFDKVVIYKLDRLARNLRLMLEIEDKLKKESVSLHSIKESLDTSTAIGRTVFQVLGLTSEWERDAIVERTRSGRIQRYKEGRWAGGKPPYGYLYDKETKKLAINETEARIVRRIFEKYNSGSSLSAVANMLNRDKVRPRGATGKGWRSTAIRHILINPVYKGTQIVNRHLNISDIRKVDMSKAIIINVPAIVLEEAWEKAQKHLDDHKRVRPMKDEQWLLQGLITCGLCGLSYQVLGQPPQRYYRCRGKLKTRHLDGSPKCTNKNLKAEYIEEAVWSRIEEIINDPNKLQPMIKETVKNLRVKEEELQASLLPINSRLIEIADRKSRLADEFVVKNMNPQKFKQLQSDLDKEEVRLRSLRSNIDPEQLTELETTQSMLRHWESQLNAMAWNTTNEDGSMVKLVEQPHKLMLNIIGLGDKELTNTLGFPATKRELLDKLQVKVIVFPDRAEVKAVFPIAPIYFGQKCTST